eukprot:jgi/Mesvir1/28465/Mv15886-RA.1
MMMPVLLKGSCHCQAVKFEVQSFTPYPYMVCHCLTDTKTAGSFTTNIMAEAMSLTIEGEDQIGIYQALLPSEDGGKEQTKSTHKRHFCRNCACYLWASDERWPTWIWPFATCIDTPLPVVPPELQVHIMTEFKLPHVTIPEGVPASQRFPGYPELSIEQWHKAHGCYGKIAPFSGTKVEDSS